MSAWQGLHKEIPALTEVIRKLRGDLPQIATYLYNRMSTYSGEEHPKVCARFLEAALEAEVNDAIDADRISRTLTATGDFEGPTIRASVRPGLRVFAYEDLDLSAEPWVSYLWGVADQEDLDLDPYDTIEAALDVDAGLDEMPETIELHPWVRHKPTEDEIQGLTDLTLRNLLDDLYEDYGGPELYLPSEHDRREALRFVKGVVGRLLIWRCDPVPEIVEVDVKRWVLENRPDWIEIDEQDGGAS